MRRALCWAVLATATSVASAAPYDFSDVEADVGAMVQQHSLPGAALQVWRAGELIDQQYLNGYDGSTLIPIASASKWLSAIAIERLVERGQMHWSDRVSAYLADAPADKAGITLGQLFSHTSGLPADDAACLANRLVTLDTCAHQILGLALQYPSGTAFAYGGNSMQVAGRMAEIATGKTWDQIFIDEVVTPLGLVATDYAAGAPTPPYQRVNNPRIAGGVRSTVSDYARVTRMIAQRGQWNGQTYLDAAGVAEMQRDQTHGVPVISTPDPLAYGYGYGEWRNRVDDDGRAVQVSSTGAFGTTPWVDNDTGVAAVLLVQGNAADLALAERQIWSDVRTAVLSGDPVFADGFDAAP